MDTVTISLEKYNELIQAHNEKVAWFVEVSSDYWTIHFNAYKWYNQEKLWKLVINQMARDILLKNIRDEDYYKKERKYLHDKKKEIEKISKEQKNRDIKLNEKESEIDKKWIVNFLFRVWFFGLLFVVFILIKLLNS